MKNIFEETYPISDKGFKCLGPCYPPNEMIIHPITLDKITDDVDPFCPVNQYEKIDPDTNKKRIYHTDVCSNITSHKYSQRELEMSVILPEIDFNCSHFLRVYYGIFNFQDALNYIKQNIPLLTKIRLINCSWNQYGNDIDFTTNQLLDFYIEVIKKRWINGYYKKLKHYIKVDSNKISFTEYKEVSDDKHNVEKINFILKKLVNRKILIEFFNRYINENKNLWDKTNDHNKIIKRKILNHFINSIKKIIK